MCVIFIYILSTVSLDIFIETVEQLRNSSPTTQGTKECVLFVAVVTLLQTVHIISSLRANLTALFDWAYNTSLLTYLLFRPLDYLTIFFAGLVVCSYRTFVASAIDPYLRY